LRKPLGYGGVRAYKWGDNSVVIGVVVGVE